MNTPDPDLKTLENRIADAKKKEAPADTGSEGLSFAMRASVELVAGVAVGCLVGYGLDRWFGTSPWLFIGCFFLGAAGGTLNMIRAAKRME